MPKDHILVVEGEEDILELLRYNRMKEGYRVTGGLFGGRAYPQRGPTPPVPLPPAMGSDIFSVRS